MEGRGERGGRGEGREGRSEGGGERGGRGEGTEGREGGVERGESGGREELHSLYVFGVEVLQSCQDDALSDPAPLWEEHPLVHQYTNTKLFQHNHPLIQLSSVVVMVTY